MAKNFIVLKNNKHVSARVEDKAEAEALCAALSIESPLATFEFGKLDKKYYTTFTAAVYTPVEEDL